MEVREYFSVNTVADTFTLLAEIKTYQTKLESKMRKMKEAKERKKYE